jgi:hypothetical protein
MKKEKKIISIEKAYPEAYRLARHFHKFYEQSAPIFGYETKKETKEFDPESANGRLMAWVCFEVVKEEKQAIIKKIKQKVNDEIKYETKNSLENVLKFLDALINVLKKNVRMRE